MVTPWVLQAQKVIPIRKGCPRVINLSTFLSLVDVELHHTTIIIIRKFDVIVNSIIIYINYKVDYSNYGILVRFMIQ
jgi:hypothetical protein